MLVPILVATTAWQQAHRQTYGGVGGKAREWGNAAWRVLAIFLPSPGFVKMCRRTIPTHLPFFLYLTVQSLRGFTVFFYDSIHNTKIMFNKRTKNDAKEETIYNKNKAEYQE
jgi:hypothetical protein